MPNYTSHIIMATELFKLLEKDSKLKLQKSDFSLSSIGQDFTFFNAKLFDKTHTEKVQNYFLNLISYIKSNKLYNNPKIMSYLYGQIAHFCLDSTLHPLIYAKEKVTQKVTLIPPHTTVEYFIDDYLLSNTKKDIKINNILNNNDFLDDKLEQLINDVYKKTYNENNVTIIYKNTLKAIKALNYVSKIKLNGHHILNLILKYEEYFRKNHISEEFILNKNHNEWINPFSGKISTTSFDELYQKSIIKSLELKEEADKYIYGDNSFDNMSIAFPDLSYDTGIECSKGKKFSYLKKIRKNF